MSKLYKFRTLAAFWFGMACLLFVVWATFNSFEELNQPHDVSMYRWALSLSIVWLLIMRLFDLWDHDRQRTVGRTLIEDEQAAGAARELEAV